MKFRVGHLLIALLITLIAAPAIAATYDATGRWFISTTPGQEVTVPIIGDINVPDAWLWATIDQTGGGNAFTLITDKIADLGNISYSGSGDVVDAQYNLDPPLTEQINLGTLPDYENLDGIWADISLARFELTSDNRLIGQFTIGSLGTVDFTGTKEQPVPVPAAVWLLGSGVVALFGLKRRTKA